MPFCISILTSVRRIVKIAVRFLHTKTALCDRKDTQSRFAVNAARSIVCVETVIPNPCHHAQGVSMPHAALCVSRHGTMQSLRLDVKCFNAARSIVCVETFKGGLLWKCFSRFQCRTQHCVCRDFKGYRANWLALYEFQCRTQHCVCRDG